MNRLKTLLLLILLSVLTGCGPRVSTPICPVYKYSSQGSEPHFEITLLPPAEWVGIHAALRKASQSPTGAFAIEKHNVFYLFPQADNRSCLVLVPSGSDSKAYTGTVSWNGALPQLDQDSK